VSQDYKVFRNVCPRNCYGTCGILSYVKEGKLVKVEGDPKHGYTKGRLCMKGYAYPEYVYHPERLRSPMRQYPRGSGNWQRISWEEAFTEIAEKILELKDRYGFNLSLGYNKFSGNLGLLHYAVEGMFNNWGAHTKPLGNPCLAAGQDALFYDFGDVKSPDPESMALAHLIVIWGVNPAWTSIHQLHFIQHAKDHGAKLVVIDPLFTPTAAKADLYLQIKPGTDGLLALALLRILLDKGRFSKGISNPSIIGWDSFHSYLLEKIQLEQLIERIGISREGIEEIAELLLKEHPVAHWVGFGLQRHTNGGQMIRNINALVALTGNHGVQGGGLYYVHHLKRYFPQNILRLNSKVEHRSIDINHFAREALALDEPPLKFLWVASRNPLSQDPEINLWDQLIEQMELIVTVDLFLSQTAKKSDLVLPATSFFEEIDLNVGYWHRWVGLNEQAIQPFHGAKSDLQIARELTNKLNSLSPGFSNFPSEWSPEDWIRQELTPDLLKRLEINTWEELRQGPKKLPVDLLPWAEGRYDTPDGRFHLLNLQVKEDSLPALPRYTEPKLPVLYPLRLITPQNLTRLHSQYSHLKDLALDSPHERIELHPETAAFRGIEEGDVVTVFNHIGSSLTRAHINPILPKEVVVTFQGGNPPINRLISYLPTDMGKKCSGSPGIAYYDTFVEIEKNRGNAHD